jgi:alpha-galactosidase
MVSWAGAPSSHPPSYASLHFLRRYDLFRWARQQAGKPNIVVENCHNGPRSGSPAANSSFGPMVPTREWCPFHMYRSSTDIAPVYGSILSNLETIVPLASANLSYPGCFAYPDMLEVGITNMQHLGVPPLNLYESRSHFGAWCIVSSPLILGFDLGNQTLLDSLWPIVANAEALAINSDYAGESGNRFFTSSDVTLFAPCGWWAANCTFPTTQYWSKLLSNGDVAVLLMNNGDTAADLALEFHNVPSLVMPQGSQASLRDVWSRTTLGTFDGSYVAKGVASRDSVFLRISPKTSEKAERIRA